MRDSPGCGSVRRRGFGAAAAERIGQGLAVGSEPERDRIQAMAFAGRRRAVGEYVAQVAAAASADFLGTQHAVAAVAHVAYVVGRVGCEEARPAGARIELGAGAELRQELGRASCRE